LPKNTKSFFETHAHDYPKDPNFYSSIIKQVKSITTRPDDLRILDVGCGNGNFTKALFNAGVNGHFFATDISFNMVQIARLNLIEFNVKLFVADGFNVPLRPNLKFDIIHVDSVLHHLIGKTRNASVELIRKMIELLCSLLSDKGFLIVEDLFYNSYFIPTFTAGLIFYGLRYIDFLNIDLRRFNDQMRPGLIVNFLHEKHLLDILAKFGVASSLNKRYWKVPKLYRVLLLKEFGHITCLLETHEA
jgi:SAM-dependent methyltransferase